MALLHSGAIPETGWQLLTIDETESTNALLKTWPCGPEFAGEGLMIRAVRQTAGRGRRGRSWEMGEGNLALSVRVLPGDDVAAAANLSFVTAVALSEAISQVAPGCQVALKWPNDLMISGKKVSGILLEYEAPWLVIGVGVNVAVAPDSRLTLCAATSLAGEGFAVTADRLATEFAVSLSRWLGIWRQQGMAAVLPAWTARAQGVGQPVTVRLQNGGEQKGVFGGLDSDGALLLHTPDGQIQRIIAGDVFF